MEQRHYERIRQRAIEEANLDKPPKRDYTKPLTIGVVAIVAIGSFWFLLSRALVGTNEEPAVKPSEAEVVEQAEEVEVDAPELKALEDLANQFLEAESVEALLEIVDRPDRSEARMREYYSDQDKHPLPMGGTLTRILRFEIGGEAIYGGVVSRSFSTATVIPMPLDEAGQPTLPWEAAVGWMERDWDEILESKPEEGTPVKCIVAIDDYYNYNYSDEDEWQCFKITASRSLHNDAAIDRRS